MLTAMLFAATASTNATALEPVYYIVAIAGLILGGLWALKKYTENQKDESTKRAADEQKLADKLDANTDASNKNTASIEKLGEKFDSFSSGIDKRLTLVDYRVDKLEESQNHKGPPHIGGL